MNLFLVDYNYISSELLQKMISQALPEEDVVNCFSPATLLKIAEQLKPDLVIIDYALVEAGKVDLIGRLRDRCPDTYILAMIDPDYYEQLYQAIEKNLVDDYIVKPVSEDEFAARILITTRRRKHNKPPYASIPASIPQEQTVHLEEEKFAAMEPSEPESPEFVEAAAPAQHLFEDLTEPKSIEHDLFATRQEEDFYSQTAEDDLEAISSEEPDRDLREQPEFDLEILDLPERESRADDLFSEQFDLLEKEGPVRSFEGQYLMETSKSDMEQDENYFNDLFVEEHELTGSAAKITEPDAPKPAPVAFDQFDDAPERDINIPIKDFMPGESADQYLKQKEAETTVSYNEDLLDRFLSDEEKDNEEDEDDNYDEDYEPSGISRFLSLMMNIVLALLLLMMASLSLFLIHSRVADGPPALAGLTFYVMQDDNLNADVNPGSLAVVRDTDVTAVSLGDIITFREPANPTAMVTQRVVEINREDGLQFVTSANGAAAAQTNAVPAVNVLGKALILVPFYGSMVDYVQTSQGLILLIFVPGIVIILYQLFKIIRHLSGARRSGRNRRNYEAIEEE